jgi:hypothetical protein
MEILLPPGITGPVLIVNGNLTTEPGEPLPSITINAIQLSMLYRGIVVSAGSLTGALNVERVVPPFGMQDDFVTIGPFCSIYAATVSFNSISIAYTISGSPTVCVDLPPRLAPPPPIGFRFDVGALIGSLFTAIVLLFVIAASLILLNSDLQEYCLPYQDG